MIKLIETRPKGVWRVVIRKENHKLTVTHLFWEKKDAVEKLKRTNSGVVFFSEYGNHITCDESFAKFEEVK